jgi:hypothetical protein
MERSSTALAHEGHVWLIDPLRADGIDAEINALGKVVAILMTLGWHERDVDWFAALYGVPVYAHPRLRLIDVRTAVERVEGQVPDSPLQIVTCGGRGLLRWWPETAIWWPEMRALATGDALGTAAYFVLPGQSLGVHPVRRLSPPVELRDLPAERLHPGHGHSITSGAAQPVREAVDQAHKRMAAAWWRSVGVAVRRLTRRRGAPHP